MRLLRSAAGKQKSSVKTRRQFLLQSTLGTVIAAALPATTIAAVWRRRRTRLVSLASLHLASFEKLKEREFRVALQGNRTAVLRLLEVENHRAARGEHFTLRFVGTAEQPLKDNTYLFDNAELGSFEMMIVSGRKSRRLRSYAAIINRTV